MLHVFAFLPVPVMNFASSRAVLIRGVTGVRAHPAPGQSSCRTLERSFYRLLYYQPNKSRHGSRIVTGRAIRGFTAMRSTSPAGTGTAPADAARTADTPHTVGWTASRLVDAGASRPVRLRLSFSRSTVWRPFTASLFTRPAQPRPRFPPPPTPR